MKLIDKKRILIFISICCIFLAIITPIWDKTGNDILLVLMMFTPMFSTILTRIITKEGFHQLNLRLHFKKHWQSYLFAWLGVIALSFIGCGIFYLFNQQSFSPLHSGAAVQEHLTTSSGYLAFFAKTIPLAIIMNPLVGLLQCFGEEFAWRDYILPKLSTGFTKSKATLLTSLLWGLWHAPIVALGFNYGTEHPIAGVLAQILFCVVIGNIFAYLFFRTHSIWPVVLAHAALNAIDKFTPSFLFQSLSVKTNPFVGPDLTGVIGGVGLIIASIICFKKILAMKEPAEVMNEQLSQQMNV